MVDYYKEPTVSLVESPHPHLRRFLIAMAATILIVASMLLASSIHSNHYGYFGPKGQFAFYNDRQAKANYLASVPDEEFAEAFIVGSSNTMPFLPSTVERLYGLRTFNLGCFYGRAEEIWAWSNYLVRDLGKHPKLVILGVEPWTFANDDRGPPLLSMYRRTTLTSPVLAKYITEFNAPRSQLSEVLDSLTLENARLTLRMYLLKGGIRKLESPLIEGGFNSDGTNNHYSKLDPTAFVPPKVNEFYRKFVDSRPTLHQIETLTPERVNLVDSWYIRFDEIVNFLPGDRMSEQRLDYFDRALALLNERQVPVAIVMLPTHPYYFDMLVHYTRHIEHLEFLRKHFAELQKRYPNIQIVFDASNIALFGGDPNAFHDSFHMTPVNTDRVLVAMRQAMNWPAGGGR